MKKSNIVLLIALLLVLVSITVAAFYYRGVLKEGLKEGDGNIKKEQRDVSAYNMLKVNGGFTVHYTQETLQELTVEADNSGASLRQK